LPLGLDQIVNNFSSSIDILGTSISVPAIKEESVGAREELSDIFAILSKAAFAFYIITAIFVGLLFISSFLAVCLAHTKVLMHTSLISSVLGALFAFLGSITITALAKVTSSILNRFASPLGIYTDEGTDAIAITWVTFAFLAVCEMYWFAVWFVDFRTTAYKARKRTPMEIGNWSGIGKEVKWDLKPLETMEDNGQIPLANRSKPDGRNASTVTRRKSYANV
jgi:hypothetical protein